MRDPIKRMIAILEHGTPASKDRWPRHPFHQKSVWAQPISHDATGSTNKTEAKIEADGDFKAIAS